MPRDIDDLLESLERLRSLQVLFGIDACDKMFDLACRLAAESCGSVSYFIEGMIDGCLHGSGDWKAVYALYESRLIFGGGER